MLFKDEACTMKDVLSHLHTAMEDDDDTTCGSCSETSSLQGDIPSIDNYRHSHRGSALEHSTDSLDHNSNSSTGKWITGSLVRTHSQASFIIILPHPRHLLGPVYPKQYAQRRPKTTSVHFPNSDHFRGFVSAVYWCPGEELPVSSMVGVRSSYFTM